jgi:hypothetical protein
LGSVFEIPDEEESESESFSSEGLKKFKTVNYSKTPKFEEVEVELS